MELLKRQKKFIKDYRQYMLFLFGLFIVWLSWTFLNDILVELSLFKKFWLFLYHIILKSLIYPASYILGNFFGLENIITYREIFFLRGGKVEIANNCLSLNLMYIYSMFILIYPNKFTKLKIIYISIGVLIIHLLNLLRVLALCLLLFYAPSYVDINHYYIFNIISYSFVLFLWFFWIKKDIILKKS